MLKNFGDKNFKDYIPIPIYEAHPEYNELYMKAWELAFEHIRHIDGMPQNPYMDEAFCDTQIWIWDSCFMSLFTKFCPDIFPGIETLNNFYEVLYGDKRLPKIKTSEKEPWWTFAKAGVENDIYIHIADNPPLFPWVEYENLKWSGDKEHIRELLYEKQYLQKHYEWIEDLKSSERPNGVFNDTCLISEDIGYRWEGGRSGMDNTPRGRREIHEDTERPNNPDLLWLDAICQQALAAKCISELFSVLGDTESAKIWNTKYDNKKAIINKYYWDERDSFYYDIIIGNNDFCKVKSIASYWTLTAEIASDTQARKLVEFLSDPNTFGSDVPLVSLAKNDGDYYPDGRYWRGGLWLPTAYAALCGIIKYGYTDEARCASEKIIEHMYRTYKEYEPHTIWECYSPEFCEPASSANGKSRVRPDFCGWSALGPISMYIEFVLGLHSADAVNSKIKWAKPEAVIGEIGIKNLSFGEIATDISAKENICTVKSNLPYTLEINGVEYSINKGINEFSIK